jgi:hypothetical protein
MTSFAKKRQAYISFSGQQTKKGSTASAEESFAMVPKRKLINPLPALPVRSKSLLS